MNNLIAILIVVLVLGGLTLCTAGVFTEYSLEENTIEYTYGSKDNANN
jgi:hypothetical protein